MIQFNDKNNTRMNECMIVGYVGESGTKLMNDKTTKSYCLVLEIARGEVYRVYLDYGNNKQLRDKDLKALDTLTYCKNITEEAERINSYHDNEVKGCEPNGD